MPTATRDHRGPGPQNADLAARSLMVGAASCFTPAATASSACDVDNGKVLWTGQFSGSAPGVPASYESQGRQFVLLIAGQGGGGGGRAGAPPSAPTGMVAFALKK